MMHENEEKKAKANNEHTCEKSVKLKKVQTAQNYTIY